MPEPVTTNIEIAYPQAESLLLRLGVGACRLKVTPGAGSVWVSGTYYDPTGAFPCKIEQEGGTARITQDYRSTDWMTAVGGNPPRFELALGRARPYELLIETGASEARFELGGLPLRRLLIKQGAGKAEYSFDEPNPESMTLFDVDAGAVALEMSNLANANAAEMTLDGGAASYKLDFGGTLRREAFVRINTGMAGVEVRVPATTPARIMTESILGALQVGDGFTKKEGAFVTQAALAGRSPVLTIRASVALGSLQIRTG